MLWMLCCCSNSVCKTLSECCSVNQSETVVCLTGGVLAQDVYFLETSSLEYSRSHLHLQIVWFLFLFYFFTLVGCSSLQML